MKYNDYAIEQLLNRLSELFNKKSTPKKTAGLALEAIEVIRQLRNAAAPPNSPLTLEELRQMEGEPVWVVEGKAKYYALITDIFPEAIWVTSCTDNEAEMQVDEYGKTWLAYRRRPEEATSEGF